MNVRIVFILFVLSLPSFWLGAQDSSVVRFYVKGSDVYYIRFEDRVLPLSNIQRFPSGDHEIEIWSPRYQLYQTSISVPSKDSISLVAELDMHDDYRVYLLQMDDYKRNQFWMGTAPVVLFCLSTIGTTILYSPLKRANENRVKEEFSNRFSPGAQRTESQDSFNRLAAGMGVSVGAQVASAIWFFALRNKLKSLEKPVYRQQNPFTLDYFEITYNPELNAPQAGLTLRF